MLDCFVFCEQCFDLPSWYPRLSYKKCHRVRAMRAETRLQATTSDKIMWAVVDHEPPKLTLPALLSTFHLLSHCPILIVLILFRLLHNVFPHPLLDLIIPHPFRVSTSTHAFAQVFMCVPASVLLLSTASFDDTSNTESCSSNHFLEPHSQWTINSQTHQREQLRY